MKISNAKIYDTEKEEFFIGSVSFEDGTITSLTRGDTSGGFDARGDYLLPGLLDVHTHGRGGWDIMTCKPQELQSMARLYMSHGVTTAHPCVMTAPYEELLSGIDKIKNTPVDMNIDGIHIEGPYISPKRPGCHTVPLLRALDTDELKQLCAEISPLKTHITVAPELPGGEAFVKCVIGCGATAAIGHSDASYEQSMLALEWGCTAFTHTYNAMRPLNHREPGTVGAALTSGAYAEFICDGFHIHPAAINLAYRCVGCDRFVLISDSIAAADMPDGRYNLADMPVTVKGAAVLNDAGVIAGSGTNIFDAMKNLMKFAGIPLEKAVKCATVNPAREVGCESFCGSIAVGKRADFALTDPKLSSVKAVWVSGKYFRMN